MSEGRVKIEVSTRKADYAKRTGNKPIHQLNLYPRPD